MTTVIFTLDYEIYGNGEGRLRDLVLQPAEQLRQVFLAHGVRFVNFVEAAEFERIEECLTDPDIDQVVTQVRRLHDEGFETALHLHPQWYNATWADGRWALDYREYNLSVLDPQRIESIVDRALLYLRRVLGDSSFTPCSFRAGNWLLQPSEKVARVLASKGIQLDSSVFKGGLQHAHRLDYRPALSNGLTWRFTRDAAVADPEGVLLEVPIHTEMVPFWRMLTTRRTAMQSRSGWGAGSRVDRIRDFLRPLYPLKLDFCRMTLGEMQLMIDRVVDQHRTTNGPDRPVVAIGHTKDLADIDAIDGFLRHLAGRGVRVGTFRDWLAQAESSTAPGKPAAPRAT